MRNQFSDSLKTLEAVMTASDSNKNAVDSIKAVRDGVEMLRKAIPKLTALVERQSQTTTISLTMHKNDVRDLAIAAAIVVAKRIRSAAARLNNPMLLDDIETNDSTLRLGTEKEQIAKLKAILVRAQ